MPKIEIDIPVELGTPVFLVHDKCRPDMLQCIFSGGYGTSRCRCKEHGDLCKAYYESVPFDLYMIDRIGKDIFIKEAQAAKKVEKINTNKERL